MTALAEKKLTASQARKLAKLEARTAKAKAAYEALRDELGEVHAEYKPLLPPSTDPKDAGRDVRQHKVGGFLVRVSTFLGGDYFSLKDYREAGNQVTDEMRPFVRAGDPRERWTVKDLRGPRDPDAVDPAT